MGRIPVTDVKQCEEYNAKVLRYLDSMERMLHGNEIIMAADDGDNLSHQNDVEEASAIFASHPEALLHKIYVGEYSVVNGAARGAARRLAESLDAGAGLWVYVGHGNEISITGDGLMDSYVAGVLRNDILPWGFFCSCRIGKFGASSLSFSESLLFNGIGGVIGCVTSPQEVYASYNRQVLTAFARRWADAADDGNFGDIWLAVQKECMLTAAAQANKVLGLNTLSFNLLGDPALPLMRGSRRMDCEYVRQSGCIVGAIDTAADGVDVEAVFYSSAPSRHGVIHDDIIAGKSAFADFGYAVGNEHLCDSRVFKSIRLDLRHGLAVVHIGHDKLAAFKRAGVNRIGVSVGGKLETKLGNRLPPGVKSYVLVDLRRNVECRFQSAFKIPARKLEIVSFGVGSVKRLPSC